MWRHGSIFGQGPRQALDRNQTARFIWLAKHHRYPGGLSSGHLAVAVALVKLLGKDGRLDPSHAFLARLAAVSEDTVQRGLERLRALGLLLWQRRIVRDRESGWRCEQTSNAYVLTPQTARFSCDPQIAGAVELESVKKEGIEVVQAAQAALARVAAGMEARLSRTFAGSR